MPYLDEFLVIAVVHLLAVASPGPDFAIILKQSIRYDCRTAVYTSLGIATGIMVHVTYSLVGIGILIASNEHLFSLLKYVAASYFAYVAWHSLRAKKPQDLKEQSSQNIAIEEHLKPPPMRKAFFTGFLINGLNVKATLFFVSLFSVVISTQTPFVIKLGYGVYMVVATALWFSFMSYLLARPKIRTLLQVKGYWLDRLMGVVLLGLAIELVLSDLPSIS